MEIKGKSGFKYIVDGKHEELIVEVELKKNRGLLKPRQNLWYAVATVNGKPYEHPDLPYCVHAQYEAEAISDRIYTEYKSKYKAEGKSFRVKRK